MAASRWILVADGARARLYEQQRPGASLVLVETLALGDEDEKTTRDRPPRTHDSLGPGRHAMEASGTTPHEAGEARFLGRVARYVQDHRKGGRFDALLVLAAPRALGLLRDALGDTITHGAALDVVDESAEKIHARLAEAGYR